MKRMALTITMTLRDGVPARVVTWMTSNLLEYITNEFSFEYDPEFVDPPYEGPPLADDSVDVKVTTLRD